MMRVCLIILAVVRIALTVLAVEVTWDFPRLGNCHEGMAFADGVTGVLVWGGGDELRLTVGRADMWDHRGGYAWTDAQNYTNIVALWKNGEKDRLLSLFKKQTPVGEPRNPYMLPLGRVVVKIPGQTLAHGKLDTGGRRGTAPKGAVGVVGVIRRISRMVVCVGVRRPHRGRPTCWGGRFSYPHRNLGVPAWNSRGRLAMA